MRITAMERVEERLMKRWDREANDRAKAKASRSTPKASATCRWQGKVRELVASGMSRPKAIVQVDIVEPGLRAAMLAEANKR
ncbi:MAG: hypothetical protein NXI28_15240 [bacterium]|nr:hypothetical protein [bacterium]